MFHIILEEISEKDAQTQCIAMAFRILEFHPQFFKQKNPQHNNLMQRIAFILSLVLRIEEKFLSAIQILSKTLLILFWFLENRAVTRL